MVNLEKDIGDYVKIYNTIPIELCDHLIEYLNNSEQYEQHNFYNASDDTFGTRSEKEFDISYDYSPRIPELYDVIWKALHNYVFDDMKDLPWLGGWEEFSAPRFNRYTEDSEMALHADHIKTLFDGQKRGIPVMTALGCLNDNYEGGEFVMWDKQINLQKGDIIIFPSNYLYPHKVNKIKKGTRYSFVSWAW